MPYDGAFTSSIVKELAHLVDCRVEKIHQPSDEEIVLLFKKDKKAKKILCCANPAYPRVHISEQNRENPQIPPTFCMILRKYLGDGKLIEVNQINFDRIIEFKIENRDELGYPVVFYLVVEIMGKHSNIILLNSERVILDSIKHIGSNINRYREVVPGAKYIQPPVKDKLNPLVVSERELQDILTSNPDAGVSKIITDSFLGISKPLANEICGEYRELISGELTSQDREVLTSCFFYYFSKIKSGNFDHTIFYDSSNMVDYYIFPLNQYKNFVMEYYDSPGKLLDVFYSRKDLKDTLKQKFNDVFKLVSNLIERNSKKIQIHVSKIEDCRNYEKWKINGDLIMANQFIINDSMEAVEVENFYDPDYSVVVVPLEKGLKAVENAQKYYKKYSKEKNTIEIVAKQLEEAREEHTYLESILYNLENASDINTIEEIKNELSELGYIKKRKRNQKSAAKSAPYHYKSSDGFEIYVGKNNQQNDFLTTKFAVSSDIWMHTKNIPGSHVIIKSQNGYVSDTALLESAKLAAFYSRAKNSTNVPVDYTERKNVKKPSGAKPGMVIYYTNKTIYVTPDEKFVNNMKTL